MRIGHIKVLTGGLIATSLGGCGPSTTNNPGVAAAVAVTAVAAAGVNRAATKSCWGRCSDGFVCNRESGLCEPGECNPKCGAGYACTITPTGRGCVPEGNLGFAVEPDRKPSDLDLRAPREADLSNASNTAAPAGRPTIGGADQGETKEPSSSPQDQAPVTPDAERRARGAAIFNDLDQLRDKWKDRASYQPRATSKESAPPKALEVPFAKYLNGLHRFLHPVFSRGFLESLEMVSKAHALNNQDLKTSLELVIDADTGKLITVGLLETSGNELFDVAALESVSRAGPFAAAPDLRSHDGTIVVHWQFQRNAAYACSAYFAKPQLLTE